MRPQPRSGRHELTAPQDGRATWRDAWPLLALLVVAAAVRFSTLDLQSFWYDEAYTPVHVLHASLGATLRTMVHTENSPPLWYVAIWVWSKLFGTSEVALRSLSALAGVGLVAVAWAIGREVGTRATAIVFAAIVALNPLFWWYSQEARVYELFALMAALSLVFFLRARRTGTARDLAWWSGMSVLALVTHYFAIFLVGPEAVLLLYQARRPGQAPAPSLRATAAAVGAVAVCTAALIPLAIAQGGHGTQWIGRWALGNRLVAIPGYFLLGGQSPAAGHLLLLACAIPGLVAIGLVPSLLPQERARGLLVLGLGLASIAIPFAFALVGADYLAPRNLIASWIPLVAALAVVLTAARAGRAGTVLALAVCAAGLGIIVAINLSPKLQRGDWRGVAHVLRGGGADRAVVTVELGSAPLEYYRPGLGYLHPGNTVHVSEVDLVGYRPLKDDAPRAPSPAFRLAAAGNVHGLLVYRFLARTPQTLTETQLRRLSITDTASEVLVPGLGTYSG